MILYNLLLFSLPILSSGSLLEVKPRAVFVSRFDLSDWKVSANLNSQFSFHNPNKAFNVKIKSVEGTVYNKNIEALTAATILDSFKLKVDELEFARIFSSIGFDGKPAVIRREILEDILKDLKIGFIQFSLKMTKHFSINEGQFSGIRMCEELNVKFTNQMGSGRLMKPAGKDCRVTEFQSDFH